MMKLRNIYISMLALLLATQACKKEINIAPENATYDQAFWVSGANADKALAGAYTLLRSAFKADRSYFIFGDLAANNFKLGGDYWNYTSLVKDKNFNFNYAPYLGESVANWSRFYQVINQCHLIIENTPNIPDSKFSGGAEQKHMIESEARFIRAYTYFYMTRVWGDVILTKESFKDPLNIPALPRTPEAETLDFALEDLAKASAGLDYSQPKTHAGKGAALGLTAHIYAWRHNYPKAQAYCDSVINSGEYSLEDIKDYKMIWAGGSDESMLEVNMLYDAGNKTEWAADFFNVFLAAPFIKDRSTASAWTLDETYKTIYEVEDGRDTVFQKASDNSLLLTKYSNVNYYDPVNASSYAVSNNLVLMRLADIYLLRAEARYKNGNQAGCQQDMNTVRARAGRAAYNGTGTALFNELVDERRRELIGEGQTAYDLIRMEQLQRLFPDAYSDLRIAQKGYYWPLEMRVLAQQNPLLTQNEWWKGHF